MWRDAGLTLLCKNIQTVKLKPIPEMERPISHIYICVSGCFICLYVQMLSYVPAMYLQMYSLSRSNVTRDSRWRQSILTNHIPCLLCARVLNFQCHMTSFGVPTSYIWLKHDDIWRPYRSHLNDTTFRIYRRFAGSFSCWSNKSARYLYLIWITV